METVAGAAAYAVRDPASENPADDLMIAVLGPLTAVRDGQELHLGGWKQRAVLALLVIARGEVVAAERLADSLWQGQPPAAALHTSVSRLRRVLEPERRVRERGSLIGSEGSGYALRVSEDALDAWRFERLVRNAAEEPEPAVAVTMLDSALQLWRGPAFTEYADQPWARSEADRLTELRAVAREKLLAARLAAGESAVLVPELETLVAEGPYREERWRLLALALYRSHRQADALGALRRARKTLADELGVDPGPALRGLEAEVLAQSPTLDPPLQRVPPLEPANWTTTARSLHDTRGRLIDREEELAQLTRCVQDVLSGQPRIALIEGPAGIGKSRLLKEVRRVGERNGATTLTARGTLLEREYGFGVVRQLFEPVLVDSPDRDRLFASAAQPARAVFENGSANAAFGGDSSFAVLHGLYWLTVNLSNGQPLLLAVDDLQWCDSASLRFLAYLVHRLAGLPVMLAVTVRTGEDLSDSALLEELAQDVAAVRVRPAPLTVAGVAELVRRDLGDVVDERFARACHETTGGNPLLMRQLLHALEADRVPPDAAHVETVTAVGSRAISSLVLQRLRRLPPASTSVARAVAILGDGAALPNVAALSGLSELETATAIGDLARIEVVRDSEPVRFVHPLVCEAVYRDLTSVERALRHKRAAQLLSQTGAGPDQVAAHLLKAPPRGDPWVVHVLREAAAAAIDRGAPESAVKYLSRARAEPPHVDDAPHVLLEIGTTQAMRGGAAAIEPLRQACATLADPVQRASAAQTLVRVLALAGPRGEASAFARATADQLPNELVDERQGLVALERIAAHMHDLDPADYASTDAPAVVGTGPGARLLAAALAWDLALAGADRSRAVELARFALEDGSVRHYVSGILWVVAQLVLDLAEEGDVAVWDHELALGYAKGSVVGTLTTHLWRGQLLWLQGDLREALETLERSNEHSKAWGSAIGRSFGHAFVVRVLLDQGVPSAAREYFAQIRGRPPEMGDGRRLLAEAEATLLVTEGRHADALAVLDESATRAPHVTNPAWRPWRSLRAQALAGLGRVPQAIALVEEELELARRWGARRTIGRTLRVLGELRGRAGASALREAVEELERSDARLELARALHALAAVERSPAVSAGLLRRALDLARACEAAGLRDQIIDRMHMAGVEVPPEPAAALTATEQRIAAMSANGVDELEIAQVLHVTPLQVRLAVDTIRRRVGTPAAGERH